jgi:signal transduction histidine kinase/DNA-binding response OmpR family regulator/ligand-binding sensor domain-containing protein
MKKGNAFYCFGLLAHLLVASAFLSLLFPLTGKAQSESEKGLPFITNYSPKTFQTLPQVWSIEQSKDGIMYFGIQNYVLEYDGVKWKKLSVNNTGTTTVTRSLSKSSTGTIYYGAYSDLGYITKDSLGQSTMKSLINFVPSQYRNFLDVWTTHCTNKGIYFQSREYIFRISEPKPDGSRTFKAWKPQSKFMYAFYLDGDYYVHQQGLGLYKLVNDSFELIPGSEFLGKERMQVMLPYPKGANGEKQWLVGMFYSGLYIYNGKTFKPFTTEADFLFKTGTLLYKGLLLNNGNYVLSTTGKGLAIIDAKGKLVNLINRNVGLQDESIYGIYQDNNSILWLAMDNGISRVDIASPFTQFNLQSGINTSVLSMTRFQDNVYIGTSNGLLMYDNKKHFFETVKGIAQNQIFGFLQVDDELLIPGDGLYAIKNRRPELLQASISGDLTISAIYQLKTHPEYVFAGGVFGGSFFKKDKSGKWRFLGYVENLNEQIWTASETADGKLWVGTQSGIVFRLTPSFDQAGNLLMNAFKIKQYGPAEGFRNLTGIVINIDGGSYFPTDSTLVRFDDKTQTFVHDTTFFKKASGLASEFAALEEKNGRIWFRLGKEVLLAEKKPGGGYSVQRNLMNNLSDFAFSGFYSDNNGTLWIATTDGLIRYDESLRKNSDLPFRAVIRTVSSEKTQLSSAYNNHPTAISYKNNTIRFDYAAPFFEREDKTQYQTWLEGFDPGWSELGSNYYKEYTNLPDGKYRFHVRAMNIYNKQSEEAIYEFSILPPWYQTWWAYLLYAVAAILSIYSLIRWRTQQLQEKHRELEKVVAERTAQLSNRIEELAVINTVQQALVSEMNIQGIYELIGEKIREIFNAQVVDIVSYDSNTNLMQDCYAYEKGDRTLVGTWEPYGFRKHVIETKKVLLIKKDLARKSEEFNSRVLHGEQPKSAVWVPLISGDDVKGMISLQDLDKEDAFNESDINVLTTLANSMTIALESAKRFDETKRLLKETEQRTAELGVINNVQEGLVREMNMQAIYDLVGNRICELFDTQTVLIRTFDQRTESEHWQYAIERGQRMYSNPRPIMWANKRLLETKQPLLINNDYIETARKYGGTGVSKGLPPKSAIFVPMIVGDVVRGSISLQNVEKENVFTETDVRLLATLTNSMSVALENARLFDETNRLLAEAKQRANELTTVNSISQALASHLNLEQLINLVGEQLKQLFRANIVYLAILDSKTKIIDFPYQYGDNMLPIRLGDGLTSKIILSGQPLLINKDVQELRAQLGVQRIGIPAASYLGVPIPVGDEIIGVLSVQSTEHENRFNHDDMRLLTTIAAAVGLAIRKARLFEEVQAAKMDAEAARKTAEKANEAKSAFLSTVSHELRTPLTSVLGFAKIIKRRLEEKIFPLTNTSDPKTAKTIQQINENLGVVVSEGERLTHLINDVLDLAKIEAGKMEWNMETVSIVEVTERAIAATTALFENKNLFLQKTIQDPIPDITGDRDKLIQVMVNLISNAVKFTPQGNVSCNVVQKKDEIIVSITDTGIGIAPQDHAAVFEQFKQVGDTLTDKPKGTGLGLPICKEIIEHHGGRIWVESQLGKGSTFSFALPVVKTSAPKPIHIDDLLRKLKEQVNQSQLNKKGNAARLLIVDDDDSIRSLLEQELGDAGYLIEQASNGKEALAKVRANKPDLIILDIMMPEMNGFDVAAVLKNDPQTMDIPIIVLSIVQDKTRGFRIGVDCYLTKPIDTNLLFNEIGNLLEQGKSKKKVIVVDEDSGTVNTLTEVLKTKGYAVTESNGRELFEKAVATQPDIIIMNSVFSDKHDVVQALRFEKGLENVLFLLYQ